MTIQQLLQQLALLPPNTRVVVSGYEGGYNDITALKTIQMVPLFVANLPFFPYIWFFEQELDDVILDTYQYN